MSKYTTGEIAKLCGVSVRTVQYYDTRGILIPSELSEGGRRIYSEDDLRRMKLICFLRELNLPIDSVKELFEEEHPENVILLILDEQEKHLKTEIEQKEEQVRRIAEVRKNLKQISNFSVESIGDIAHIMENKKKLKGLRVKMLVGGIFMDAIEASTLTIGILTGKWLPFFLGMIPLMILGIWISFLYFTRTVYICPECHTIFRPKFKESFFARHTPNTRKLTCSHCSYHGFCVETYGKENNHAETE